MDTNSRNVPAKRIIKPYGYNGFKKTVVSKDSLEDGWNYVTEFVKGEDLAFLLSGYKNNQNQIIVVYDMFKAKPKENFQGAYFTLGKMAFLTPNYIVLDSSERKNIAGIPVKGSAPISLENVIDVFLSEDYALSDLTAFGNNAYEFGKMHCEKFPMERVSADNPVQAFMQLTRQEPSMKAEMQTGYTIPVKLVDITPRNRSHSVGGMPTVIDIIYNGRGSLR